jgi:hypothetical protein
VGVRGCRSRRGCKAFSSQVRGRLTVLSVIAAALFAAGCEPLGPDELRREVQTIHSVAAEGSVLADQIAAQRTKRTFARVQARELADNAEHSSERLTDAHPQDDLIDKTDRAITLAEKTSEAIGELETAPDDAQAAQATAATLRALAAKADGLAAKL